MGIEAKMTCKHTRSKTLDSRSGPYEPRVPSLRRRRRQCLSCGERFTTYEMTKDHIATLTASFIDQAAVARSKLLDSLDCIG